MAEGIERSGYDAVVHHCRERLPISASGASSLFHWPMPYPARSEEHRKSIVSGYLTG
jgi:hypothetical protein